MDTPNEATSRNLVLGLVLAVVASFIGQIAKFFWIIFLFDMVVMLDLNFPFWILGFELSFDSVLFVPPIVASLFALALHKTISQKPRYYLWCFGLGFLTSFILFWVWLYAQ